MILNRIKRIIRPHTNVRPNWNYLKSNSIWIEALTKSVKGKKILIATSTGANWSISSFDSLLAVALTLKGAKVEFLLCDGALKACQECDYQLITPKEITKKSINSLCKSCFNPAYEMLKPLSLKIHKLSDYDNKTTNKVDIKSKVIDEHSRAGTLRYFAKGELQNEPYSSEISKLYRDSANTTYLAAYNLIKERGFEVVVAHHGIYVPQGPIVEAARSVGSKVVCWGVSYRKKTVLFNHGQSYHYSIPRIPQSEFLNCKNYDQSKIIQYLKTRENGSNDWISFYPQKDEGAQHLKKPINNNNIITYGLFTNVVWDAQLHFKEAAYKNMIDWVIDTIKIISTSKNKLIIRIHPAEKTGTVPSRQPILDEINEYFPKLPKNVEIIEPNDDISSYDVAKQINIALVYGTKLSIELATMGIPVLVTGDAWVRGKGFTWDFSTKKEYREFIKTLNLPLSMDEEQIEVARKFAYYIFFERMIEVTALKENKYFSKFTVDTKSLIDIKNCQGLQKITNGIINGDKF